MFPLCRWSPRYPRGIRTGCSRCSGGTRSIRTGCSRCAGRARSICTGCSGCAGARRVRAGCSRCAGISPGLVHSGAIGCDRADIGGALCPGHGTRQRTQQCRQKQDGNRLFPILFHVQVFLTYSYCQNIGLHIIPSRTLKYNYVLVISLSPVNGGKVSELPHRRFPEDGFSAFSDRYNDLQIPFRQKRKDDEKD